MTHLHRLAGAILVMACALFVLASCQRPSAKVDGPKGSLAVAGFFQPQSTRELMAGYLPEDPQPIKNKLLGEMDAVLSAALGEGDTQTWIRPPRVDRCRAQILEQAGGKPGPAFNHWLQVGRCVDAQWLLVPQVTYWRERDGSEVSVREAASVTLDLFLISVTDESIVRRYHFEETQRSLTENILDADKFVRRGGKWITALDLAREGIRRGVKEFGL